MITVVQVDLANADHQRDTVELLNAYAMDPMGDGRPLSEAVRRDLVPGLQRHPTTMVFLAYQGAAPVGLAVCFLGFSTLAARPLVNISDYFAAVERRARELGCCKLTLEVQENNTRAKRVYAAAGFSQAVYVPEAGGSLSMSKRL
jgi:hypothetical protein